MDNKAELEKIEKEISRIIRDANLTLVSIQLTGYSSPEAPYSTNARLSEGRTKALKTYLVEKYNLPSEIIHTSYIPVRLTPARYSEISRIPATSCVA